MQSRDNELFNRFFDDIQLGRTEAAAQFLITNKDQLSSLINKGDDSGRTPLCKAAMYDRLDLMAKLFAVPDVNINTPDFAGDTPLAWAAWKGQENAVRLLLSKLNLNEIRYKNKRGETAAEQAKSAGYTHVASLIEDRIKELKKLYDPQKLESIHLKMAAYEEKPSAQSALDIARDWEALDNKQKADEWVASAVNEALQQQDHAFFQKHDRDKMVIQSLCYIAKPAEQEEKSSNLILAIHASLELGHLREMDTVIGNPYYIQAKKIAATHPELKLDSETHLFLEALPSVEAPFTRMSDDIIVVNKLISQLKMHNSKIALRCLIEQLNVKPHLYAFVIFNEISSYLTANKISQVTDLLNQNEAIAEAAHTLYGIGRPVNIEKAIKQLDKVPFYLSLTRLQAYNQLLQTTSEPEYQQAIIKQAIAGAKGEIMLSYGYEYYSLLMDLFQKSPTLDSQISIANLLLDLYKRVLTKDLSGLIKQTLLNPDLFTTAQNKMEADKKALATYYEKLTMMTNQREEVISLLKRSVAEYAKHTTLVRLASMYAYDGKEQAKALRYYALAMEAAASHPLDTFSTLTMLFHFRQDRVVFTADEKQQFEAIVLRAFDSKDVDNNKMTLLRKEWRTLSSGCLGQIFDKFSQHDKSREFLKFVQMCVEARPDIVLSPELAREMHVDRQVEWAFLRSFNAKPLMDLCKNRFNSDEEDKLLEKIQPELRAIVRSGRQMDVLKSFLDETDFSINAMKHKILSYMEDEMQLEVDRAILIDASLKNGAHKKMIAYYEFFKSWRDLQGSVYWDIHQRKTHFLSQLVLNTNAYQQEWFATIMDDAFGGMADSDHDKGLYFCFKGLKSNSLSYFRSAADLGHLYSVSLLANNAKENKQARRALYLFTKLYLMVSTTNDLVNDSVNCVPESLKVQARNYISSIAKQSDHKYHALAKHYLIIIDKAKTGPSYLYIDAWLLGNARGQLYEDTANGMAQALGHWNKLTGRNKDWIERQTRLIEIANYQFNRHVINRSSEEKTASSIKSIGQHTEAKSIPIAEMQSPFQLAAIAGTLPSGLALYLHAKILIMLIDDEQALHAKYKLPVNEIKRIRTVSRNFIQALSNWNNDLQTLANWYLAEADALDKQVSDADAWLLQRAKQSEIYTRISETMKSTLDKDDTWLVAKAAQVVTYKKLNVLTEEKAINVEPSAPLAEETAPRPPNDIPQPVMQASVYPSVNTLPVTPKQLQSTARIMQSAKIQSVVMAPETANTAIVEVDDFWQSLEQKTLEPTGPVVDFSELLATVDVTFKPAVPEKSREQKEREFYSTPEREKPILIASAPKEPERHINQMALGA